jgi:hypothetical protein
MFKRTVIIGSALFFILNIPIVFSQDRQAQKAAYFVQGFKEFGVFSGFHKGDLKEKEDYEIIPAMLHFGFDLRPLIKNKSNMLLEFLLEPFLNTVISPDNNLEVGNNFLFRIGFPLNERLYPYIEGGCGLAYLSQHTREQSTQFNFTDQGGVGITYFLKKNLNISLGYRFRHVSNASIKSPNSGINVDSFICGISFLY